LSGNKVIEGVATAGVSTIYRLECLILSNSNYHSPWKG